MDHYKSLGKLYLKLYLNVAAIFLVLNWVSEWGAEKLFPDEEAGHITEVSTKS